MPAAWVSLAVLIGMAAQYTGFDDLFRAWRCPARIAAC